MYSTICLTSYADKMRLKAPNNNIALTTACVKIVSKVDSDSLKDHANGPNIVGQQQPTLLGPTLL